MTKKHKPASRRSRKSATAAPAASQPTAATATTAAPQLPPLARIHHLSSCAVLSLPRELRDILGEEGFDRCVKDFEDHELAFLIHIDGDVIYLRSQMILLPQRPAAAA